MALAPEKVEQLRKTYQVAEPTICKPRGCTVCNSTGYKGRTAIHEILTISTKLGQLINQEASTTELAVEAKKGGFKTLQFDGFSKAVQGFTTFREVEKVALA